MSRTWQSCPGGEKRSPGMPSHDEGVHVQCVRGTRAKAAASRAGMAARSSSVLAASVMFFSEPRLRQTCFPRVDIESPVADEPQQGEIHLSRELDSEGGWRADSRDDRNTGDHRLLNDFEARASADRKSVV